MAKRYHEFYHVILLREQPTETKIARIDNLRPTALIDECAKPRQNNRRKGK